MHKISTSYVQKNHVHDTSTHSIKSQEKILNIAKDIEEKKESVEVKVLVKKVKKYVELIVIKIKDN